METKEIKISCPEGYEIDKENSTFECIKFKPIIKRWRDDMNQTIDGYCISGYSSIEKLCGNENISANYNIFATKKQAKSALAMARISQIMDNDPRFGGPITDEEWKNGDTPKYIMSRCRKQITRELTFGYYTLLAFHTEEQRELFLVENEDLIKDYLMID